MSLGIGQGIWPEQGFDVIISQEEEVTSPCATGTRRVKQSDGMLSVNKRPAIAFATACLQHFELTTNELTRLMALSIE